MMWPVAICAVLAAVTALSADQVELRGSAAPIEGRIVSAGDAGIRMEVDPDMPALVVPWHQVRSVTSGSLLPRQAEFLERGEMLWRASGRLRRGDIELAEPLMERAFLALRGASGADARLAAEGLLRCRLANGNLAAGVLPLLEATRLAEAGAPAVLLELPPIIDVRTGLCPHLPPVLALTGSDLRAAADLAASGPPRTAALARLLLAASDPSVSVPEIPGVEDGTFGAEVIVAARGSDAAAIAALSERLKGLDGWQAAWAHFALARGLLARGAADDRTAALLHLASVAGAHDGDQPWLAGAAMARLADELERDGKGDQARRIRLELETALPAHPLAPSSAR